jgi:hypothetical protein
MPDISPESMITEVLLSMASGRTGERIVADVDGHSGSLRLADGVADR